MSFPKIYTVNGPSTTSSSTLPSWLALKSRPKKTANGQKKRTKTQHQVGQLELIQDFTFPQSALRIKTTPDGTHAIGTGLYKPMMKVWDLEGLGTKFERVTEAENVDFVILSSDWTKTLHLQRDRSLQLHTQGGLHHTIRLPTYGRSVGYHSPSADALVGATGTEIFRFNLEEGRYMTPLNVAKGWGNGMEDEVEGVNVVNVNPRHGLWSFGLDGGGGVIEFWDPRSRSALTRLTLPAATLLPMPSADPSGLAPTPSLSITALSSHPTDGLSLAVGTSTGHTLLYDLRSPTPFAIKDQGYGEPIKVVDWLRGGGTQEDGGRVVSADSKVIKVWDKGDPSTNHLSLHPPSTLTDLHAVPGSGILFVACDSEQLSTYYIPELGPAPRWASFLDSVTEELAEDTSGAGKSAYADFKFVDRAELDTLNLTHLIGTPALKPYMHGYFLSLKLYTTARLIANPQSYDEYRDRVISEKIAAKTESRIRARKDAPRVNKALAERLRKAEEREAAMEAKRKEKRAAAAAAAIDNGADGEEDIADEESGEKGELEIRKNARDVILSDPRFKELWENPDYEVDENTKEFEMLNPRTAHENAKRKTAVEEEEDESDRGSSDLEESESEANSDASDDRGELSSLPSLLLPVPRRVSPRLHLEAKLTTDESRRDASFRPPPRRPTLPSASAQASGSRPRLVVGSNASDRRASSFGDRMRGKSTTSRRDQGRKGAKEGENGVLAMRRGLDGGMEMSFVPRTTNAGDEDDEYGGGTRRDMRAGAGGPGANGEDGGRRGGRGGRGRGRERGVERFGAGMEKRTNGDLDEGLSGNDRQGRTQRRHGVRSGSKSAFRRGGGPRR